MYFTGSIRTGLSHGSGLLHCTGCDSDLILVNYTLPQSIHKINASVYQQFSITSKGINLIKG